MPNSDQPTQQETEKLQFNEFLKISKWVISLLLELDRANTIKFFVSAVLVSLYSIANTYLLTRILDVIVNMTQQGGATLPDTFPYLGIMILLSLTDRGISLIRENSEREIDLKVQPKVEMKLYTKLQELGIQTLSEPGTNDKINRAERQIYQTVASFYHLVNTAITSVSLFVRGAIVFVSVPFAVPIIIVFSLPSFFNDKKHRSIGWKFYYDNTEKRRIGYSSAGYLQTTAFLEEIFVSGGYKLLDQKFRDFISWYTKEDFELVKKWIAGANLANFLTDVGVYAGYLMALIRAFGGLLSVGDVFFQMSLINSLRGELGAFFRYLNRSSESILRVKDIYSLLVLIPSYKDGTIELPKMEKGPEIKVSNLFFKYPRTNSYILNDINLNIKSGEKVAIVGHNGAGKTSLIKLLMRMYTPTKGKITIDEKDLNKIKISSLYKNTGVLFQDYNKYNALTVKENVFISGSEENSEIDEEAVVEALDRADALEFVNEFPNKLDQILSERYTGGVRPSTGQWQKLAIARFFYRNSPLVIFDEPTAAIDAVSEYNIFNKIYSFFEGKTVIIISHRFSTVRNADRIIVLEKGRIIEEGNHEELMKKDGYYANSFKLQAEGYSTDSEEE